MYSDREAPLSRDVECYVCGEMKLTNRDFLPPNWIISWDYDWTICPTCRDKIEKQLGYELDYFMKGTEPDPMDQFKQEDFFL